MEELYRWANLYSMLEDNICEATQTVMIINQLDEGKMPLGKKPFEPKEGQSRDQKLSHDRSQKKKELP